jgi:hypothetical protein
MYYRLAQTDNNGETVVHEMDYLENCSLAENGVIIYPNPAKRIVNILSDEKVTGIKVINPEGKGIDIPVDLQLKQLDFNEMPVGIYFIRITTVHAI